jgi:hypothetical protein
LILRTLKVGSWLRRKRGDEAPAET